MRSNLVRFFAVVMGVSLSLTILAACGAGTTPGSGTSTAGSTVIKIAADLPLSGKEAGGGKSAEDGALLAVNEALDKLAEQHPRQAELVKLRYFVGMTVKEAAEVLGISADTAKDYSAHARAWLFREISQQTPDCHQPKA